MEAGLGAGPSQDTLHFGNSFCEALGVLGLLHHPNLALVSRVQMSLLLQHVLDEQFLAAMALPGITPRHGTI